MATILDTLITRFGYETDTSGLDAAKKGLGDFKTAAMKVAGVVGGLLGGGFLLNQIAGVADETLKWADSNGIAMQSLGELEFAVQRQGGSIDGLRSSLSNINKSIGEVQRGTGRAKLAFEDYGISVTKANGQIKTADEIFVELNKKFEGLSKAQQFDLAMKMGIDKGTIRLLQTAPDEVARLRLEAARLGVLTRQDAARAADFNDGLTNMAQAINAIKFEIGGIAFKPLSDLFKLVAEMIAYFRKHKFIFVGFFTAIGAAMAAAAIKAIGMSAALAGLRSALKLLPPLAILAGTLIAMEELWAFFTGAPSAIGDFLKDFPRVEAAFRSFGDYLGKELYNHIERIKKIWETLVGLFTNPIETINKRFQEMADRIREIYEWSKKMSDRFMPDFNITATMQPAPAGTYGRGGIPVITRSDRSVMIQSLNVDARGGDSKEIAANVASEIRKQANNTVENFDSRVAK